MSVRPPSGRGILHIDGAYTLAEAKRRGNVGFLLGRDASGLFQRVWSVHPNADRGGAPKHAIDVYRLTPRHGVIEGKVELCRLPAFLQPLNVLISQIALYRVLVRLVRDQSLDVVVGVDPFLAGLLGLAVARKTNRPFVLRVSANHDELYAASGALAMPRFLPTYSLQKWLQRFLFKRADLVTAINENNLEYARKNDVVDHHAIIPISGNIEPLHSLAPSERASPEPLLRRLGIPVGTRLLLYFGRLIPLKHPDDAVRAMAQVIQAGGQTHGIVAGTGSMEPELRKLATDLGFADRIHFVGKLNQKELSQLLPTCVVLSPSAGQMALLESALAGSPIVAYDRDFQPEFIVDGVNGFIVPFRDWRAMASRVEMLLHGSDLIDRLSKASRQSALDYMAPERTRALEWAAFARVLPLGRADGALA